MKLLGTCGERKLATYLFIPSSLCYRSVPQDVLVSEQHVPQQFCTGLCINLIFKNVLKLQDFVQTLGPPGPLYSADGIVD